MQTVSKYLKLAATRVEMSASCRLLLVDGLFSIALELTGKRMYVRLGHGLCHVFYDSQNSLAVHLCCLYLFALLIYFQCWEWNPQPCVY